jgi:hypothetical protein
MQKIRENIQAKLALEEISDETCHNIARTFRDMLKDYMESKN